MLTRHRCPSGVVLYRSPLLDGLGIRHGFSTRIGGVSGGVFASLNLGNPMGIESPDPRANLDENYRRFMAAIDCPMTPRASVHQVHGCGVAVADEPGFTASVKADALISTVADRAVTVRTADCCPILIATADGSGVAAVHAGWRGAVGGVIEAAVGQLERIARQPAGSFVAAVGPCIGFEAFEVGAEVIAEFERVFGRRARVRHVSGGKGFVDLNHACVSALTEAGVATTSIDTTDRCTVRDAEEFFSHRRDDGLTGRMAAVIATGRSEI